MKKALMYWINYDRTAAAGPVWVDIPESNDDFTEIRARQARLMDNPVSYNYLSRLKSLGFRWLYSASANQSDGYDDEVYEGCEEDEDEGRQ